jgi:bifunctional DNase/RNase
MTDLQPDAAADAAAAAEPATADPDPAAGPPAAPPTPVGPSFRVMAVEDVSFDLPAQFPSVSLIETEPPMRALVFPVGIPEGTAMAQALRRIPGRRPMTHELFMDVLQRVHVDVVSVRLIGRDEGNLVAELDLMTPTGREIVDCRPSDGLVLALRMPVPAPVLVDERLLEDGGDVAPFATT